MDFEHDIDSSSVEVRHRKEKKELQAQIQALKKAAKNDKTRKKEILAEIVRLETEMENRHQQELQAVHDQPGEKNKNDALNDIENDMAKSKISKAQKRREKKSQQEKERDQQIKLQEKENLHGPRNIEIQEISTRLKKKNLKIFPIPSDGDCLYKAVAHQMLIKRNEVFTAKTLREYVASYIQQNKDEFLPFMTNSETFEMLNDDEFQTYCDKIAGTTVWGGQLEVRALSSSLKCPINIIQASGPDCIEQGSEFDGPPLVITYHRHMYRLGEHYNSTCIAEEHES